MIVVDNVGKGINKVLGKSNKFLSPEGNPKGGGTNAAVEAAATAQQFFEANQTIGKFTLNMIYGTVIVSSFISLLIVVQTVSVQVERAPEKDGGNNK